MRIGGRHRASQCPDVVFAIPLALALEEILIDRIIVGDIIRLQKVAYILDAHTDVSQLHIERHSLLHTWIDRCEIMPTVFLLVFGVFHQNIVSEFISIFQKHHHIHDVVSSSRLHANLRFLNLAIVRLPSHEVGRRKFLHLFHSPFYHLLLAHMMVDFHRNRLGVIIRLSIKCHQEIILQAMGSGLDHFLHQGLIERNDLLGSHAMQFFCILLILRDFAIYIGVSHQDMCRRAIRSLDNRKGGGHQGG